MQKKLTISIDEKVYQGLYTAVGAGNISHFIESLVRPHVLPSELESAYQAMALDDNREQEATSWCENVIGDAFHVER